MKSTMDRRRDARAWIQPGRIMLLANDFAPTDKFLIVAAAEPALQCFVINSVISEFYHERPSLERCQVVLRRANHTAFLKRDSYADCVKFLDDIPLVRAISQLVADASRMKGKVTAEERQAVIAAIKLSPVMSKAQKDHILTEWEKEPNS
jgi:hypothetical protein